MDISKIPKFVIWTAIAVFVVSILFLLYSYYITSYLPPYLKYFSYSCDYSNGQSVIILTAKENIYNVTVYNFNQNQNCYLGSILSTSMNACEINNSIIAGEVFVRIYYNINNQTYQAVVPCSIKSTNSILSLFFH
ncbi:hypothetical protein YN1_0960 [Nanoarchaeota archaeon]